MSGSRLTSPLSAFSLALRSGLYGGLVAGLIELLLVTRFGAVPANFSGLLFAVLAYGIMGGVLGIGCQLLLGFLPFHRERRQEPSQLSAFMVSAALSIVLFLIFVFRAFRDFHAEKVKSTEPTGLFTIAIIFIAVLLLFFLLKFVFTKILYRLLKKLLKPAVNGLILAVVIIMGIILQIALKSHTEVVHSPFSATRQSQIAEKPNVIIIMADALRADRLPFYGHSKVATPNLDNLVRDGVLFSQMYTQTNNTKPSTACLFTSRYLNEHRAVHKTDILTPEVVTLAELLGEGGYYCGGLADNINLAPVYNFQQGFHEYTYLAPDFLFGANEAASRLVIYGVLRQIRMKLVKSLSVNNFYQSGETVTGYFEEFLRRQANQRFFLFLHYMDPHDPYFEHPYSGLGYARVVLGNPPEKYVEPFEKYYGEEIEYMDGWIGKVMQDLKAAGLYDQTLIVFTSDHGEEFYDHGGWWHGTTLHEEQLRVPLIIKQPGNAGAGTVVESLTNNIDITPTILQVVGLDLPEFLRGRALFEAVDSSTVFEAYSEADFEGNVGQSLRIGDWKYIQMDPNNTRKRPPQQLFNLHEDPHEKNNLAATQPEKLAEMKTLLEAKYQDVITRRETGSKRAVDAATQERMRALGYTQ